jgi:hypothetical protein
MSEQNQNADCVALLGLLALNLVGKEAEDNDGDLRPCSAIAFL